MDFTIQSKCGKARAATFVTDHGEIQTPIFMPVGTLGTVKGVHQHELKEDTNADIILALIMTKQIKNPRQSEGFRILIV